LLHEAMDEGVVEVLLDQDESDESRRNGPTTGEVIVSGEDEAVLLGATPAGAIEAGPAKRLK